MRHEAFSERKAIEEPIELAKKSAPKITPPSLCIDLLDDSDEEDEAKPAAKAAPTAKQTLFLDVDSDDDLPESVFRKKSEQKKATHAPDNANSGTSCERNVARMQQTSMCFTLRQAGSKSTDHSTSYSEETRTTIFADLKVQPELCGTLGTGNECSHVHAVEFS